MSPAFHRLSPIPLLLILCTAFLAAQESIPPYAAEDPALYAEILAMDKEYFEAYNTCDLTTQERIYSDSLEFYHDRGGLSTSKADLLAALEKNICGKVQRFLLPETVEVYGIPGFGAVEMGYHRFENNAEPKAPSVPSRFVVIWKDTGEGWQMYRVVSLH